MFVNRGLEAGGAAAEFRTLYERKQRVLPNEYGEIVLLFFSVAAASCRAYEFHERVQGASPLHLRRIKLFEAAFRLSHFYVKASSYRFRHDLRAGYSTTESIENQLLSLISLLRSGAELSGFRVGSGLQRQILIALLLAELACHLGLGHRLLDAMTRSS